MYIVEVFEESWMLFYLFSTFKTHIFRKKTNIVLNTYVTFPVDNMVITSKQVFVGSIDKHRPTNPDNRCIIGF